MGICLEQLEKWNEAPDKGQLLIYTRETVLFHKYPSKTFVLELLEGQEILEMHLFDNQKEYRCILSRSKRWENGVIETIANFPIEKENVYKEEILLENTKEKMMVYNHIQYDENGMATIDNYRLAMGGEL